MRFLTIIAITLLMGGCTGTPKGVRPVDNFSLNQYLGKWHEVARLDHSFERGLDKVSAEYSLRDDGSLKVINRGFSEKDNSWKEAEGKAYFVKENDTGHLKVSFFGPFYSSYIIFELDKDNYQYAFVSGYNKSYLWLLSRTPTANNELINRFVETSKKLGFNTDELILINHVGSPQKTAQ